MAYQHNQQAEWLSLIEISGPFLAETVLKRVFPQDLAKPDTGNKRRFRQTYEEWREATDNKDPLQSSFQQQWINWVLSSGLEWDEDRDGENLKTGEAIPEHLKLVLPEHSLILKPDYALFGSDESAPYLLVRTYSANTNLNEVQSGGSWSASPAEQMSRLCKETKIRLGLVTNGEQWMLIHTPEGGITCYASWYARLWSQEPVTLDAFYSLLNISTLFNGIGPNAQKLSELYDESLQHQDEVTETLGSQVQRAVEVLIQSLDRINTDSNGVLLNDVKPAELYEAGLTYMMRLVFLLCAEERGLLLLGDETYEANYAVSTLRMKLREEAGLHGEEVLSYRTNAWSRLLALFRAVYGGIEHESLRMPALGGSLFDPDRFPFLEGRAKGTNWKIESAKPLPIDNRTVLLFLDAIQLFQGRTLSYRALDVEQIGYVYEGLLERTAIRTQDVILELDATKSAKKPWVTLAELNEKQYQGTTNIEGLFKERTGSSATRVTNDLAKDITESQAQQLLVACQNNEALKDQLLPYFHFVRLDAWGNPMVYPKGSYMVATGADRRETGTHYTPKSLTEVIVLETLEPVVYLGPAEGKERAYWQLKSPSELLALKVCDPAMGSGAFLVQVCRYLSERLCEAWLKVEQSKNSITLEGFVVEDLSNHDPLPKDAEERLMIARRLVAEHCLYGVDVNPLAVELAKLAIWLVTLSKGRPFGFLDHNLKAGNSLLGIHSLDQLYYLNMLPEGMSTGGGAGKQLFAQRIETAVDEALALRKEIRDRPVRDIRDIEVMEHLNNQAHSLLAMPELIADALIGETLVSEDGTTNLSSALTRLSVMAGELINNPINAQTLKQKTNNLLATDVHNKSPRKPFHWPLAFPEVFGSANRGFDALVGNVPFLGGQLISGAMGTVFRNYLVTYLANAERGSADLAAYFFLRADKLLGADAIFGLITTNTIAEGDTRKVALEQILSKDQTAILSAYSSEVWPGKAAVVTSRIHLKKGNWKGRFKLNKKDVTHISAFLTETDDWSLQSLSTNENLAFQGVITLGLGFVISNEQAAVMLLDDNNKDVVFPYINGLDLNSSPEQKPSRWVINFFDMPENKASQYILPYKHIAINVKPERQKVLENGKYKVGGKRQRELWWQYDGMRKNLFHTIGQPHSFEDQSKRFDATLKPFSKVLSSTIVSKHLMFSFIPSSYIYANTINIFATCHFHDFAILQSAIHAAFVWKYASRLKRDLRYTPSDVYLPFPKPEIINSQNLDQLGETYHELRSDIMKSEQIGLTKLYNRFHDPEDNDKDIIEMRLLHQKIDEEVALQYGWSDLNLNHGFHEEDYLPENDRIRFTISEEARHKVLDRLVLLNKERYEKEQLSTPKKAKSKPSPKPKKTAQPTPQISLFDEPAVDTALNEPVERKGNQWGAESIDQILAWLESKAPNWYTKDAILTACGASTADWESAVKELLNDGDIEAREVDSIPRYRASD